MVIGNGQLAHAFYDFKESEVIIFASGVSNSNSINKNDFLRERDLLISILTTYRDRVIVYFSSCALSSEGYTMNAYYQHKLAMEALIHSHSTQYYIFRIPQLFGDLKAHSTLINFFYYAIKDETPFIIYNEAYRYVIDIEDVRYLVEKYLEYHASGVVVDLANSYKYSVKEIIHILEGIMNKKGNYKEVRQYDDYNLNLERLHDFIKKYDLNLGFCQNYLEDKLSIRIAKIL